MYLVSPRRCCYEGADLTFLFFADRNHFFSLATVLQKKKKPFLSSTGLTPIFRHAQRLYLKATLCLKHFRNVVVIIINSTKMKCN